MNSRIFLAVLMVGMSTQGWSQAAITPLEVIPASGLSDALNAAPLREGPPPITPDGIPHQQHDQNAPLAMQQRLMAAIFAAWHPGRADAVLAGWLSGMETSKRFRPGTGRCFYLD